MDFLRAVPLWRIVKEERAVASSEAENTYNLVLDPQMWRMGATPAILFDLVMRLGMDVPRIDGQPDWTYLTPERFWVIVPENMTPSQYIRTYLRVLSEPPRLLSIAELEDIFSVMPTVQGADKYATRHAREQLIRTQMRWLSRLTLSPIGIPLLKAEIVRNFERSRIQMATPVGMLTAEAIAQNITQTALKSKHGVSAGASADVLSELLYVRKGRSREITYLYFNQQLTYDQIIEKKRDMVAVYLSQVILEREIFDPNSDSFVKYDWHNLYLSVMDKFVLEPTAYVLRIHLDVELLWFHKITMGMVVDSLENKWRGLTCVASPLSVGIIDVYAEENELAQYLSGLQGVSEGKINLGNSSYIFFEIILIPQLEKILLKGIERLEDLVPVATSVWSVVLDEFKLHDGTWILTLNETAMRVHGVGRSDLERLSVLAGFRLQDTPDGVLCFPGPAFEASGKRKPGDYIGELLQQDRDKEQEYLRKNLLPPDLPFLRVGLVYSAEAVGKINTYEYLRRDDIDVDHTVSNNPIKVYNQLGTEAARNVLIRELTLVIREAGSDIDPRHITEVANTMTDSGPPRNISSAGLSRQNIDFLSLASAERAVDITTQAGIYGRVSKLRSVSAAAYVGGRASVGTGQFDVPLAEGKKEEARLLEEYTPTLISAEEVEAALSEELESPLDPSLELPTLVTSINQDPAAELDSILSLRQPSLPHRVELETRSKPAAVVPLFPGMPQQTLRTLRDMPPVIALPTRPAARVLEATLPTTPAPAPTVTPAPAPVRPAATKPLPPRRSARNTALPAVAVVAIPTTIPKAQEQTVAMPSGEDFLRLARARSGKK